MTLNLSSLLMAVVMACGMAGAAMGQDGSGSHLSLCATSTGWAKCPIELTVSDRWTGIAPCKILGDVLTCWPIEPTPSFPVRHVEWLKVEPEPPSLTTTHKLVWSGVVIPITEMDVPAIRLKDKVTLTEELDGPSDHSKKMCEDLGGKIIGNRCQYTWKQWSCADKRRILLTDESGGKHCISFK